MMTISAGQFEVASFRVFSCFLCGWTIGIAC